MAPSEEVVDDTSASTDAGVNELRSKNSGIGFTKFALLNCCSPGSEAAAASDFSATGPLDGRVLDPRPWSVEHGYCRPARRLQDGSEHPSSAGPLKRDKSVDASVATGNGTSSGRCLFACRLSLLSVLNLRTTWENRQRGFSPAGVQI